MKRTTAISLLFLLLASQFGHHLLYSLQDWDIREEQERRILNSIPEAYLERIEDSPTLSWEEPGKEFHWNGKMYDVVRSRTENGRTVHYALSDDKEAELVKTFARVMNLDPNGPSPSKDGKLVVKLQIPVFTMPETPAVLVRERASIDHSTVDQAAVISRPRSVLPCPPWA